MRNTVLITGAGGFLGGHIAAQFVAAGWRTVGVGRSDPNRQAVAFDAFLLNDLSEPARLLSLLERYAPNAIVHLAAPASVPQSWQGPLDDFVGHVLPTAHLLDSVRLSRLDTRFILVSSAAVYGSPASLPVAESAPLDPISPYGFHKLHQEVLLTEYGTVHGLRCCKARVFSTYGENLRRLAIWDITRRALVGDYTVLGTGEETRDYLYAGDVGRALVHITDHSRFQGEAINVGSGESVAMRDLALAIYGCLGLEVRPSFTGDTQPGMPLRWRADTTVLQTLTGFSPRSWNDGLQRTVEWIRTQVA